MQTSSRKMGVFRSRKSEASSTETGISVSSSKIDRVCGRYKHVSSSPAREREETAHSETRMITSTTSDEHNPSTPSNNTKVSLETSQSDRVSIKIDSSSHGVDD